MDAKTAQVAYDAISQTRHDRLDFRTKEAKVYTAWVANYLKPYVSQGDRVLDIGCSSGKASFALEQLGADVTGIDCSSTSLDLARSIALDIGSGVTFVEGDYHDLPFPNAHFDVAVFPQNIVECSYPEVSNLMVNIKRVLCDGGRVLLSLKDHVETKKYPKDYDLLTGEIRGRANIPGEGTYNYPAYFWTVAFANSIVSQYLTFVECVAMDRDVYLLVFEKEVS